ncbi:MAG: type II toxin-antitoxin system RelE/ParE family toxin [Chlorobaculum sp.]|jgi:mRNA interferase RelE/StbE|nr:type II toxin-antitoxin system RelE/ParE family toxin [Chlorobaculum sp.]
MSYRIEILRSARKQLEKIEERDRHRIIDAIRLLAENPRPSGSKKLSGRQAWRIRIGTYRVIYEVQDKELVILVVTVGHRREVYR